MATGSGSNRMFGGMKTDPRPLSRGLHIAGLTVAAALVLTGCAAVTVPVKIVTLPVKAAVGVVDVVTRDASGF
ncbi:hypothetical protein LCGC14_1860330 [marine sediment metagenome]|uniref:Uncharacterized protein n=1 Tax=marine sediment metagenome TaxID=412755 RepID=A0A0F9GW53_9ZZZZ